MAILDLEESKEPKKPAATPAITPTASEPEWFMPGSKSEAAVRGFADAATLGLAPKISAGINSLTGGGDYGTLLKEYLAANRAAQTAQPGASLAGNIVGGVPTMIAAGAGALPLQIAKGAAMGGLNAYGQSENEGTALAKDVAQGAGIAGGLTAAVPVVGKTVKGLTDLVRGSANPTQLAEAAIKFKNAPIHNTAGQQTPGAARRAFEDLQPPQGVTQDVWDSIIREQGGRNIDPATMKAVIAQHNAGVSGVQRLKDAATPVLGSATVGGLAAGYGSDWDPEKMAAGAIGAGTVGAASGTKRILRGDNVKLRMPGVAEPGPSTPLSRGAEAVTNYGKTQAIQSASRDVNERTGTPTTPFGKITNYLSMASGTSNPAVTAAAQQAQAVMDEGDPDKKRKMAMELSASETGRAVTNQDSPNR